MGDNSKYLRNYASDSVKKTTPSPSFRIGLTKTLPKNINDTTTPKIRSPYITTNFRCGLSRPKPSTPTSIEKLLKQPIVSSASATKQISSPKSTKNSAHNVKKKLEENFTKCVSNDGNSNVEGSKEEPAKKRLKCVSNDNKTTVNDNKQEATKKTLKCISGESITNVKESEKEPIKKTICVNNNSKTNVKDKKEEPKKETIKCKSNDSKKNVKGNKEEPMKKTLKHEQKIKENKPISDCNKISKKLVVKLEILPESYTSPKVPKYNKVPETTAVCNTTPHIIKTPPKDSKPKSQDILPKKRKLEEIVVGNSYKKSKPELKPKFGARLSLKKSQSFSTNGSDEEDFNLHSSQEKGLKRYPTGLSEISDLEICTPTESSQTIMQQEIANIQKRIKEKAFQLNVLESNAKQNRHNLGELLELENAWKRGCQEALQELHKKIRNEQGIEMDMQSLMQRLNIPQKIIRFETNEFVFNSSQ